MKPTFKAWNGQNWQEFKSTKAAYKMLRKRFLGYTSNGKWIEAADMDGEQIHIVTENDEYSYAEIIIAKLPYNEIQFKKYKFPM